MTTNELNFIKTRIYEHSSGVYTLTQYGSALGEIIFVGFKHGFRDLNQLKEYAWKNYRIDTTNAEIVKK